MRNIYFAFLPMPTWTPVSVLFCSQTSKDLRKGFFHKENPLPYVEESKKKAKCQKGVEATTLGD